MSLLIKSTGISKLSELEIDADKEWQLKGVTNIKQVAAGMGVGHVVQQDGVKLVTIVPGAEGHVLTSRGPGHLVYWGPATTYFWRVFAALLEDDMSFALIIPILKSYSYPLNSEFLTQLDIDDPDHLQKFSLSILGDEFFEYIVTPIVIGFPDYSIESSNRQQIEVDDPAHFMKLNQCDLDIGGVFQIPTPVVYTNNPPIDTNIWTLFIENVEGAIAFDSPVYTSELTQATNPTVSDMTLLPATPAGGDCYYFGSSHKFAYLKLMMGQVGVGSWLIGWEYWNGAAWVSIGVCNDDTGGFMMAGERYVIFTEPVDWALTQVPPSTGSNLYWIRARVTAYSSVTTQPKGTRAWVNKI